MESIYTVIERSGRDDERTVYEAGTYEAAIRFMASNYSASERLLLGADILKNGSTDF